jgi:hypothetical protein
LPAVPAAVGDADGDADGNADQAGADGHADANKDRHADEHAGAEHPHANEDRHADTHRATNCNRNADAHEYAETDRNEHERAWRRRWWGRVQHLAGPLGRLVAVAVGTCRSHGVPPAKVGPVGSQTALLQREEAFAPPLVFSGSFEKASDSWRRAAPSPHPARREGTASPAERACERPAKGRSPLA